MARTENALPPASFFSTASALLSPVMLRVEPNRVSANNRRTIRVPFRSGDGDWMCDHRVVQIAVMIPGHIIRLRSAPVVCGTHTDLVFARRRLPGESPLSPATLKIRAKELGPLPLAFVNFAGDLEHPAFSGKGTSLDGVCIVSE